MNTSTERRQHNRFPARHLQVMVKSLRNHDSQWELAIISSVDFSRYGIGLETEKNYVIGDILSMVIRTDDATVAEVNGLVCNRTVTDYGYRLGIRFEHENYQLEESPEAMINISEEILLIEKEAAAFVH